MDDVDDLLVCLTCQKVDEAENKHELLCAKCFISRHNGHQFEPAAKKEILSMNKQMSNFLQTHLKTYETIIPTVSEKVANLLAAIPKKCEDFEEKMQENASYEKTFEKITECREFAKNYESICEDFLPQLRLFENNLQQMLTNVDKLKSLSPTNG